MHEIFYVPTLAGFPDVLAVIRALQGGIPRVLGGTLVGLYLTGSLSYGGFDPASSDIDFLALCRQRPRANEIAALSAMHRDIASQTPDWAERIEGSYIWESLLTSLEPPSEPRPYINGGAMWASEPRNGSEHCGPPLQREDQHSAHHIAGADSRRCVADEAPTRGRYAEEIVGKAGHHLGQTKENHQAGSQDDIPRVREVCRLPRCWGQR
jgi:hypothetical protein